jgi:O-succinylbenzoic acid--CoA ligase
MLHPVGRPTGKNARVTRVSGSVAVIDAPSSPDDVKHFLGPLAHALSGGAPLLPLSRRGPEREQSLAALGHQRPTLPWDAALVVPTSGSTGLPRLAVLSRAALATSADLTHAALGGPGRWLLALPTTHIAGLQVLVRSLRSGLAPQVIDVTRPFSVDDFVEAVAAMDVAGAEHPHYAALVPTQLQRLIDHGAALEALWQLDAVLVGGAALPPTLAARARDAGVVIVSTYGMTETCGGCVYDGKPLDGVLVDVNDEDRIRIKGPVLFDGYLGEEDIELAEGWFVTDDVGHFEGGSLTVDGRSDNVIVSGGVKVSAETVERALISLSYIKDAVVIGVRDDQWGERVVAFVSPDGDRDVDTNDVRGDLRDVVPDAWRPKSVIRLDALPLLSSGKPDRVSLQRLATDLAR